MNSTEIISMLSQNKGKIYGAAAILVVVIIVVIVFLIKKKKLKNLIVDTQRNQELINEANITINTDDITLTQDQFSTYAAKLYKAMKGWGTNEQAVYNVFEDMDTRSDVQQLIKTFGTKDKMTLKEWLYDEFNEGDIEHINAILASKSINFKF